MRSWNDNQLREAAKKNYSIAGIIKELGLIPAGGNYQAVNKRIKELGLDITHFKGQAWLKGKTHSFNKKSIEELLIKGSNYQSFKLKNRILLEGLKENKCEVCGISEWQGKKLALHLDHVNGDKTDNRLKNLKLLCPNCHSQTETYCGKNKGNGKY